MLIICNQAAIAFGESLGSQICVLAHTVSLIEHLVSLTFFLFLKVQRQNFCPGLCSLHPCQERVWNVNEVVSLLVDREINGFQVLMRWPQNLCPLVES